MDTTERYTALVRTFSGRPGVSFDDSSRGAFGASALKVHGKIFAMISSRGQFVVKLPRKQVDTLVVAGQGVLFDPGHGRLMKEWIAFEPAADVDWQALAEEALAFVGSKAT